MLPIISLSEDQDTGFSRSAESNEIEPVWWKTFVGRHSDYVESVITTTDGGYLILAYSYSFGYEDSDVWLIKIDENGEEQWSRTYGGPMDDRGLCIIQTASGDILIAGDTCSYGYVNKSPYSMYEIDAWLIKLDAAGNELWNRTYGGPDAEMFSDLVQTNEGGYLLLGSTSSYTVAGVSNFPIESRDTWLVKTDENGVEEWNRTYGTNISEYGHRLLPTGDGAFLMLCINYVSTLYYYNSSITLQKIDTDGNVIWNNTYGNLSSWSELTSVQKAGDGGYILTGRKFNSQEEKVDMWLVKVNGSGQEEWNRTYGGDLSDGGNCVQTCSDGGFIISGYTRSFGLDEGDIWLVRTDPAGHELWNKTFNWARDSAEVILTTSDGGYLIAGRIYTSSGGTNTDIILIRTDADGGGGKIKPSSNSRPYCSISNPYTGDKINGVVTFKGSAEDPDNWIVYVEVRINEGPWQKAKGTEKWDYTWDSTTVSDGDHTIYARAFDGYQYYYTYAIVKVRNAAVDKNQTLMPYWGINFLDKLPGSWNDVQITSNGSYIITGVLRYDDREDRDAWLALYDAEGNETWSHHYGGLEDAYGEKVMETGNGGFVVLGRIYQFANTNAEGEEEYCRKILLLRTDKNGTEQWTRTLGDNCEYFQKDLDITTDGGFIILGTFRESRYYRNMQLIRTDPEGNEIWHKTFNLSSSDEGYCVRQTDDGGFIITGGLNHDYYTGQPNIFLLKVDKSGVEVWNRTFWGDRGADVRQTKDGGYILTGEIRYLYSNNVEIIMLKTDPDGNEEWGYKFGSPFYDFAQTVYETSDGGFITAANLGYFNQLSEIIVVKLDPKGKEEWRRVYDYSNWDWVHFAIETGDGDYTIAGKSEMFNEGGGNGLVIFKINEDKPGIDFDKYYDDLDDRDNDRIKIEPDDDDEEKSYPFRWVAIVIGLITLVIFLLILLALIRSRSEPK